MATDTDTDDATTSETNTTTALATTKAKKVASPQKVAANRRNARRSTGPTSPAGKAVVAANAVRHGLLSWRPVLPHAERADDWLAHLAQTLQSLAPAGHLEAVLSERVALLLWRLDRAARHEREAAADEQQAGGGAKAEEHAAEAALHRRAGERVAALAVADDADPVDGKFAAWVVESAAGRAGVELYPDEDYPSVKPVPEPAWAAGDLTLEEMAWTAGRVREYVAAVAEHAEWDGAAGLLEAVGAWVASQAETAGAKAAAAEQYRRSHLLPGDRTLARVQRYEAALERSLYRALHELQRLQAARQGQHVPPPAAVDVTGLEGVGGDADG